MVRSDFFVLSAFAVVVAILPRECSCLPVQRGVPPHSPFVLSAQPRRRAAWRLPYSVARLPIPSDFRTSGGCRCAVGDMGRVFSSAARVQLSSPAWLLPVICGQQALIKVTLIKSIRHPLILKVAAANLSGIL
ncbi:uncharacterized protein LOC109706455 isoform X2 [Ananas comosus]|nr:uncharacterized protein LOC109706455 isoform X2 [Ananas comosus]